MLQFVHPARAPTQTLPVESAKFRRSFDFQVKQEAYVFLPRPILLDAGESSQPGAKLARASAIQEPATALASSVLQLFLRSKPLTPGPALW